MTSIVLVCGLLTLVGEVQAFPIGRLRSIPLKLDGTVVNSYVVKDHTWPYNESVEDNSATPNNVLAKVATTDNKMNELFRKLLKGEYF